MKNSKFKEIFVPTISLFLICVVVAIALSLTNSFTKDKIKENEQQTKEESMKTVCSEAKTFNEIDEGSIYEGLDDSGNVVGYAISTSANGYGGQINVMTGFTKDGKISAIDVFYNDDETPGLGKNTSEESFTNQFKGKDAKGDLIVSKDYSNEGQQVDAVTSATISSRAVVKAVNEACTLYQSLEKGGQ